MAMVKNGNGQRKWLATSLMLTLMAGISSIALAQDARSESLATTDGVNLGADHHRISSPIVGTWVFDIYGVSSGIRFHSLISFTDGGVLITNAEFLPHHFTVVGKKPSMIATTPPSTGSTPTPTGWQWGWEK